MGALLPPKTIQSLPKEILLRIFEFVYQASCSSDFDSPSHFADPTLFPACIEGVCPLWKKLALSIGHFSSRILVFVDKPVVYTELRTRFTVSKKYSIDVYVVRKGYDVDEDLEEKARVRGVMQLLVQHIKRCRVVVFDVLHNSSLPHVSDFGDSAAKLLTFRLRSRLPGIGPKAQASFPANCRNLRPFYSRPLRYLDMDANIFMDAMSVPGWYKSFEYVSRKNLTLRNLPCLENNSYDLHKFLTILETLGHFHSLVLENVEFNPWYRIKGLIVTIFVQNFEFIGLSKEYVSEFLDAIDNKIEEPNITLIRCGLECQEDFGFRAWCLTLCNIAPEEDLYKFLCCWDGFSLILKECPGVNDNNVLRALSTHSWESMHAKTLRQLQITTSGPILITMDGLKRMVIERQEEASKFFTEDHPMKSIPLPMHSIYISGSGHPLTPSDLSWFSDNLDFFYWHASLPRSDSPVLDWDISNLNDLEFQPSASGDIDPSSSPLPPVSQTPSLDPPADHSSSPPTSQPLPSSSPVIEGDFCYLDWPNTLESSPPPRSKTPDPDSPILDDDLSRIDWSKVPADFDLPPPEKPQRCSTPDSPIMDGDFSTFDWSIEQIILLTTIVMKVAVFGTQKYDLASLTEVSIPEGKEFSFTFLDPLLDEKTAILAAGHDAICIFVNDICDAIVIKKLADIGVKFVALRCAGYNNVDLKAAHKHGIKVARVPAYSPEAVAEFTVGMIMTVIRKYHKAYNRVREGNFLLDGLLGFNIHGKTVGLIGTGKIGLLTGKILSKGFGANVIAYDPYPSQLAEEYGITYVEALDELLTRSDIISLHCPLNESTKYIINDSNLAKTKKGVVLINTSRGGLIDTYALIRALKTDHVSAVGLDVYERESNYFFADSSAKVIADDSFARLLSFYNVFMTGHQAFLTSEALQNIAETTVNNLLELEASGTCKFVVEK
ncbi:2-hydroxyacid dehydrogenase-like protein [Psilocybe cubensis]|uniref:2-hydroxyacid dehydrogenase-like protein n=1 Tax=Psilocybe cubensis TaxID=181762 RepID=A0ACB8GGL3_PSICU|nr:2-hydroxyacid dehydrogenase-like protein [Psilocybe cubensis]KAH9474786.1 2-hydroxyacid dehydrogenase-like protein [Psilocybe cubensis]